MYTVHHLILLTLLIGCLIIIDRISKLVSDNTLNITDRELLNAHAEDLSKLVNK